MAAMPLASPLPTHADQMRMTMEVGAEWWVVSIMPRGTALKRRIWVTKRLRKFAAPPYAEDGGKRQGAACR